MTNGLKKEDSAALKGVAILLMVFAHCFRSVDKFGGYGIVFEPFTADMAISFSKYCKICVSIFAFVSGYGLMFGYSRRAREKGWMSNTKWVGSHLVSTLSGYWFIAPFAYVIYGYLNNFRYTRWGDTASEQVVGILADSLGVSEILGTKSVNGAWWYMGAAITFIVLIPVLYAAVQRFGSLVCLMFLFLLPRVTGFGYTGGNSTYPFLMIMFWGMLSCKYDIFTKCRKLQITRYRWLSETVKFLILLAAVVFGVWSYSKVSLTLLWEYGYAVIPFFLILFLVLYIFPVWIFRKPLEILGKHSANIWLTHTFVRDWLGKYVWSVEYFLLVPLVMIAISLVIDFCLELLKKITGYNKLIRKILAKMK